MYEKRVGRAYQRDMAIAMVVYLVLLFGTILYARGMADGILRTLLLVSPIVGVVLLVWALARHMQRVDEFVRKFALENMSLAAGLTAGLTFTYGFLETAGFPRLSMFAVLPLMFILYGVIACARAVANRE
ncbi:MAG: hypothetical protein V4633_17670 [Pseudomonadota bacterium]